MKKHILILAGSIQAVLLMAGGSFWGGMTYQISRANAARANFMNARGGQTIFDGQMPPGNGQIAINGQPGMFGARGMSGEVTAVVGNEITLKIGEDTQTVILSESTHIQKTETGSLDDIQPGTNVSVMGASDEDGSINADLITILNGPLPGVFTFPAEETAP